MTSKERESQDTVEIRPADPAAVSSQTATEPTPAQREDAFKKLRRAVGKEVRSRSTMIATSLVDATIKGNSNSARIVVGLVDKRPRNKREKKQLKDAALANLRGVQKAIDLAAEPEWQDGVDGDPAAALPQSLEKDGTQDEAHQ